MAVPIKVSVAAVMFCNLVACGLKPGAPYWIDSMISDGMLSSLCEDGVYQCDKQVVGLANAMLVANSFGGDGDKIGAFLSLFLDFKSIGIVALIVQICGWVGLLMSTLGKLAGHSSGLPQSLIICGTVIGDGNGFMGYIMYPLFQLLPGNEGFLSVMSMSAVSCGSFLAMFLHWLMKVIGLNWFGVLVFQIFAHAVCMVFVAIFVPATEPAAEKAGEDTENKQKGSQAGNNICMAWKIIWQNIGMHGFTMFFAVSATGWASFYCNEVSVYARYLFHNPESETNLIFATSFYGTIFCVFVAPAVAYYLSLNVAIASISALMVLVIGVISWPVMEAQHFVALVVAFSWTVEAMVLNTYFFSYFSIHVFGLCMLMLHTLFQFPLYAVMILQLAFFTSQQSHPDQGFTSLAMASFLTWSTFGILMVVRGLPRHPTIIPQMEKEICMDLAGTRFSELAGVMNLPEETLINILTNQLMNSTLLDKLVERIDVESFRRHFHQHTESQITAWFTKDNIFWRASENNLKNARDWDTLDKFAQSFAHNAFNHRNAIDKKSISALQDEVTHQKSELVWNDIDGTVTRIVEIVVLRVCVEFNGEKYFLIEVIVDRTRNVAKTFCRLPATKKSKVESQANAIDRLLKRFEIGRKDVVFSKITHDEQSDITDSLSYPGLPSRYVKHFVDGRIQNHEHSFSSDSRCLLAKNAHSKVGENPQAKRRRSYEWLTEHEVRHLQPTFSLQFPSSYKKMKQSQLQETSNQLRVHGLTARITRNLRKRDLTKIQQIFTESDKSHMTKAVAAMEHWTGPNLPNYVERLREMMQQHISMHEHIDFKSILIEIMVLEILAKKRKANLAEGTKLT